MPEICAPNFLMRNKNSSDAFTEAQMNPKTPLASNRRATPPLLHPVHPWRIICSSQLGGRLHAFIARRTGVYKPTVILQ